MSKILIVDDESQVRLRSDLAEAIGIGQHIDVPEEAEPERPLPPVKFPGTPRNSPRPCGSGKKYKKCCYMSFGEGDAA